MGDCREPPGGGSRVQQEAAVVEACHFVFVGADPIRTLSDERSERPVLAVVVTVCGSRHDFAVDEHHELLDQSPGERTGVHLDSLTGCGENPRDAAVAGTSARNTAPLELSGESPMLPGDAVVVGKADIAVLHVVIGFQAAYRFEETGMRPAAWNMKIRPVTASTKRLGSP
ncbi:hypothetical protein AHiyo8_41440 [Arthrobacter sp. Hiyo8]|nr:hypothetical protein AHiyo8_41440 [Arthrobacter sp. Hiyo8]